MGFFSKIFGSEESMKCISCQQAFQNGDFNLVSVGAAISHIGESFQIKVCKIVDRLTCVSYAGTRPNMPDDYIMITDTGSNHHFREKGTAWGYKPGNIEQKALCSLKCCYDYALKTNSIVMISSLGGYIGVLTPDSKEINNNLNNHPLRPHTMRQ